VSVCVCVCVCVYLCVKLESAGSSHGLAVSGLRDINMYGPKSGSKCVLVKEHLHMYVTAYMQV
jgi:hypothetical protein